MHPIPPWYNSLDCGGQDIDRVDLHVSILPQFRDKMRVLSICMALDVGQGIRSHMHHEEGYATDLSTLLFVLTVLHGLEASTERREQLHMKPL